MSLYEALTRKKTYEDRLSKLSLSSKAIFGYYTKGNPVINGVPVEDAEKIMKGNFDSFMHIKSNIKRLQIAINKANLENTVIIPGYNNGEPVTIVQAVTERQHLDEWNTTVNIIARKLEEVTNAVDNHNNTVLNPKYAMEQVSKLEAKDKKSEDTAETYDKLIASYMDKNRAHLCDPNNILRSGWIEAQRKEIDNFVANVHTVLTKANTEIMIEVELED